MMAVRERLRGIMKGGDLYEKLQTLRLIPGALARSFGSWMWFRPMRIRTVAAPTLSVVTSMSSLCLIG